RAAALDTIQRVMVCAENAAGASLVVADRPTGDKHNSPRPTKKKRRTDHNWLTKVTVTFMIAGMTMTKNETPANTKPSEKLDGIDGCRLPNFTHSQAKTGASITMNSGSNDWNHDALMLIPANSSCVR